MELLLMPCRNCNIETCNFKNFCMLTDKLWRQLTGERHKNKTAHNYLCLKCVEQKLERKFIKFLKENLKVKIVNPPKNEFIDDESDDDYEDYDYEY